MTLTVSKPKGKQKYSRCWAVNITGSDGLLEVDECTSEARRGHLTCSKHKRLEPVAKALLEADPRNEAAWRNMLANSDEIFAHMRESLGIETPKYLNTVILDYAESKGFNFEQYKRNQKERKE